MASSTEITSREYKLLLSTTRFHELRSAVPEWLELVDRAIGRVKGHKLTQEEVDPDKGKDSDGNAAKPDDPKDGKDGDDNKDAPFKKKKERRTWFLDTRANAFRAQGWILRVRVEDEKVDLTVKFRCPDRLLSGLKDASSPEKGKPKFEEDIVPPFASQYSRSNTLKERAPDIIPDTVAAAAALFPALGTLDIIPDSDLVIVDDLKIHEVVLHVGGVKFGEGPALEMSHTFWYVAEVDDKDHYPMVAEFSFEFKSEKGEFHTATIDGAGKLYRELQQQAGWLDVAGTTKSALVAGGV